MSSRISHLAAVGLALLSTGAVSYAEERSSAIAAVTAAYHREEAAIGRKDLKAVTALYSSSFTDIDETGDRSDLAGTRKRMLMVFQMVKTLKLQQIPQKFVVQGSQVTVTGASHLEGVLFDPQKRTHRMVTDGAFIDIWVRTGRGWLKRQSRSVTARTTFDGKRQ